MYVLQPGGDRVEVFEDLGGVEVEVGEGAVAVRRRPMVAAASMPLPITSPTTSAVLSPPRGRTSYQSPPIS